jgi:polar amino acid transport system substrate-binding protein
MSIPRRSWFAAPLSLLCLAAISGCGSSSSSSATKKASTVPATSTPTSTSSGSSPAASTPAADPKVAALVPSSVKSKGTLSVASDASYAPNEFFAQDGKTVIGMDVDLVKALGAVMGLKVSDQNATFDAIIPDLASGKFDLGASSFTDTKKREQTVDFVDYFIAGTSFYTKASGGTSITGLSGLCGLTVAVEKGTTELTDAQGQSAKCTKGGKKPVGVISFPDQNGANLALNSGRAQIVMADSPVAAYAVKQAHGQFKLVGQTYGSAPYGLALPKGNGMTKPVLAALQVLMKAGTYTKILARWGVQGGAIAKPGINGATS